MSLEARTELRGDRYLEVIAEPPVARVTMSRAPKLNALNQHLRDELQQTLTEIAADDRFRAVILTGAGRAFTAGYDLSELDSKSEAPLLERLKRMEASALLVRALREMPQVTIAAVNGPCIGIGVALVAACDLRFASTAAWFSVPEVTHGMAASWEMTAMLGTR